MKKHITVLSIMAAALAMFMLSTPVHASELDDRIVSAAKSSYVFKTLLQGDDIHIASQEGNVTLTGRVADEFNKSLAQETLAGLPGVKSVDNRLDIKGALPTANSDAWIRNKVKAALVFHRSVNADTTIIEVNNGIVTLRGDATSAAQRDLTTEYAMDVEGVKEVQNEMTVAKAENKPQTVGAKIDDASITAQVKMTLLYHRSTSAINTKVETTDGVVTLYGKAGSTAEKDLVTKFTRDINGVKDVWNRMTVDNR